jgi:hypothetical protein
LEISNIRVNVTGLLNPLAPTPVQETVFAGAEGVATLFQSNAITVGYVLKSFTVTIGGVNSYVVCLANPGQFSPSFSVTFSELFAGALKTQFAPTPTGAIPAPANIPGGEQGTFIGAGGVEATPTTGTRVKFVIANIPAGVTGLVVPNSIYGNQPGGGTTLELDLVPSSTETGPADPAGTGGSTTLVPSGGTVTVIYQVNTELLSVIKSFTFSPTLVFAANAIVGAQPAVTITTSYSPSPAAPGGALLPITTVPNFANTGTPLSGSVWSTCETDLLFPFVTTIEGYETGIAISNTAADPFGTTGQPGVCNLYFYSSATNPANPSAVVPTATALTSIAIGTTQSTIVSPYIGTAFNGYIIARCQFLYAHGYGFFTNAATAGAVGVAQGYTALVFPNTPGPGGVGGRTAPHPSENLNN